MASGNVVVIRRTISQTLVPYKEVEEKLLLRRLSGSTKSSQGVRFSSTTNVSTVQDRRNEWKDSKKVSFNDRTSLERSRSEVCLRRKSSYVRETSLDDYQERKEEIAAPIFRRRDLTRGNNSPKVGRPQSDFYPEFEIQLSKAEESTQSQNNSPEERLGQKIATLRREMVCLRRQDRQLYNQLASLNGHIKELKQLAQVRGGLFVSREDEEGSCVSCDDEWDVKARANTDIARSQINNSRMQPEKIMSPRNGYSNERRPRSSSKGVNVEIKKETAPRLQETSFEYIERPSHVATDSPKTPVKKSGKSTTPVTGKVSRKTTVRLERKSLSCQYLNSGNTTTEKRNSFFENPGSKRYSTTITEKQLRDSRNFDLKPQKSLSMCHLKRATKTADASTSDSECSTSGCYGGSSTGSELDLERTVNYSDFFVNEGSAFTPRSKGFEMKLKSEKKPKRHQSANDIKPYRKKVVAV